MHVAFVVLDFLSFFQVFNFLVLSDDIQKVSTLTMTMTRPLIYRSVQFQYKMSEDFYLDFPIFPLCQKKHPKQALKKLAQFLRPEMSALCGKFYFLKYIFSGHSSAATQMLYVLK